MFETTQFHDQLRDTVSSAAGRAGLAQYQNAIITYLQDLATGNEEVLMEREFRKVAGQRRGIAEALESANRVAVEASQYAREDGRSLLELRDILKAAANNYCQIWPFCK